MQTQVKNQKIIELRSKAAEYFQKAAKYQLMAIDNYQESNLEAVDRFSMLSYECHMQAVDCAELADAEFSLEESVDY